MAEFLTRNGINLKLEEIIKSAEKQLWIISPFLKINPQIKELLEDKDRFKIDIRVIYGKNDLRPEEKKWLASMASIRTSFRNNLHAKCYLNEKEALLTSMNLYEYSQVNNDEMGMLVSREQEPALYDKIFDESGRIMRMSEEIRETVATVNPSDEISEGPKPARDLATLRNRRMAFASDAKQQYQRTQYSRIARVASEVGTDSKTRITKKNIAILAVSP